LDGKEIPFSEENLVSLLEDNATLEAVILDAYAESVKLVKRKN
jgi:hypothetical protein